VALGLVSWAVGDLDRASTVFERARPVWEEMGNDTDLGIVLWGLGATALARGDLEDARIRVNEAVEFGRKTIYLPIRGVALHHAGRLARAEGDLDAAEALAHESLAVMMRFGDIAGPADVLEALGGIAAERESFREAARLLGAAGRVRDRAGYVRLPVLSADYDADLARARAGLADDEFEAAWAEGAAMSLEEAVAYAERGRGERKRPSAGWGALTPTELDVVRLVAQGLTNPDIAKKLFIARNTVKVHLQHVFAKLGVSTRAELAADATRRGI
jgi:DNA-binding CsgD family transcriptional regulator